MFVPSIIISFLTLHCCLTYAQIGVTVNNSKAIHNLTQNEVAVKIQKVQVMEGGTLQIFSLTTEMSRPYGRERITENTAKNSSSSTTEKIIPISEKTSLDELSEKMDHKKTVPRKGVDYTELLTNTTLSLNVNTTSSSTTKPSITKALPKKPLITVGNNEEPYSSSNFVSSKDKNVSASLPKVPSFELYENRNVANSGSDYTVPIVGVILSVPLVAILLNVIYKRSKEWWHHRHYSRMDFLIDGIYNN